jgi:hypothetical protein
MLYFEDLAAGQSLGTFSLTVTEDAIVRFALEYDFQPFHVDTRAAKDSIFGGLIASGIQTIALTMRLCNQAQLFAGNAIAVLDLTSCDLSARSTRETASVQSRRSWNAVRPDVTRRVELSKGTSGRSTRMTRTSSRRC